MSALNWIFGILLILVGVSYWIPLGFDPIYYPIALLVIGIFTIWGAPKKQAAIVGQRPKRGGLYVLIGVVILLLAIIQFLGYMGWNLPFTDFAFSGSVMPIVLIIFGVVLLLLTKALSKYNVQSRFQTYVL